MNYYLRHYGLQTATTINADGTSKSPQSFIDDEKLFDKLRSATSITYKIPNSYSEPTKNVNFIDIEKIASPDSYSDRAKSIISIGSLKYFFISFIVYSTNSSVSKRGINTLSSTLKRFP